MAYNYSADFGPTVCWLAVVWLILAGLSDVWMNQVELYASGWGWGPPQVFILRFKLRVNGLMNMPSWWQSVEAARGLAEMCRVTCNLSSEWHTFTSILILSAKAIHMAKSKVERRKSACGKVMSREGRKNFRTNNTTYLE